MAILQENPVSWFPLDSHATDFEAVNFYKPDAFSVAQPNLIGQEHCEKHINLITGKCVLQTLYVHYKST